MAMAPAWGSSPKGAGPQPAPPRQPQGPAPICFKCGLQGHFVVNCPQGAPANAPAQEGPAPHPPHPGYLNGAGGPDGAAPQASWPNHQGAPTYPNLQSYPAPAAQVPQYQQYPAQPYPHAQQGPYQPPPNYGYGPSGAPQGYNQPPQAYGAPVPAPQYGNQGYYPPQYSQYPQQGYQGGYQNAPQQYAPPYPAPPYEQGPSSYPPQGGPYQQPQWNQAQPAPYGAPPFHQQNNTYKTQYNQHRKRSGSGTRNQFQSSQGAYEGGRASSQNPATGQHAQTQAIATGADGAQADSKVDQADKDIDLLTEGDFLDDEFKWEMKKIFKQTPPTENVGLAQPLSTKFDMTPVPLIQAGPPPSVSRYARKDNVKEFVRPIRSQPQWAYLQEDPAFAETSVESELIPLDDVHDWMAKRQGVDPQVLSTRKIMRQDSSKPADSAHEQDQTVSGVDEEPLDHEMPDEGIAQDPRTPATVPVTPAGPATPTVETVDDAWAPQPGEGASAAAVDQDPTEALLASLGVTGSPKPVRKRSAPHLSISTDEFSSRKRAKIMPSQTGAGYGSQPSHAGQDRHTPPNYNSASNERRPHSNPHHSKSTRRNSAHDNRRHGTPTPGQSSHGNRASPSDGSPYNNGPPSGISPHSQFPPHGPQYRNAPAGKQTPGAHGNSPHGPPQFQDPWAASNRGNRSGQQRQGRTHNEHAIPSAPSGHVSPTVADGRRGSPAQSASPRGKPQHQPYNTNQGNQSSRRNSWSGNRRGSHSKRTPRGALDGGDDTPSSPAKTPIFSEGQNSKASDVNDPDESPLTPTSAEILGKLTQPDRKESSDRKGDETTRRPRRPQPVVEEAYSRRW